MKHDELWQKFLDEIASEINPASFHVWFNDLKLISFSDEQIVIEVPLQIHKKMLEENYYNLIESKLFHLTNRNYEIKFVLEKDLETPETTNITKEEKFDTRLNPNLNFDNFMVGETNRLAKAAAMAVAENPGNKMHNPLFLYGKSGLGKTHLMHAIGN